jgi:hypothetical protein
MRNITVSDIQAAATALNVTTRLWQKGGLTRLYVDAGRKDATVYLALDIDGDSVVGGRICVVVDQGNQRLSWVHAYITSLYDPSDAIEGSGYGSDIRDMIASSYAAIEAHKAAKAE